MQKIILALFSVLISTGSYAKIYENAEDGSDYRWRIYDKRQKGATISNIFDESKQSQVIELKSKGIRNGFVLGSWGGKRAWRNSEDTVLKWSMNFSERFVIYINIKTQKGYRYLYYTADNINWGMHKSGRYIHHGLGSQAKNGSWQTFNRDLQTDLQGFEDDNEILAVNGFFVRGSGKLDDIETMQPNSEIGFNQQQRLIADQFISIFENGTSSIQYGFAKNIGDGRGITAGRAGFTSATGDMLVVINKYSKLKPDNSLAQYTEELEYLVKLRYEIGDKKGSASTKNLVGLIEAWKEHSKYQEFRNIQNQVVDEMYFNTALAKAKSLGAELPLTILCLYDANIMHGESGLKKLIAKTNNRAQKKATETTIDEISWLKIFNAYRKEVMLSDSTWKYAIARVEELDDLIESQNYQLAPFKMVIQKYEGETHYLPVNPEH